MPELPDIVVYLEALQSRVVGERLDRVRIASPLLLRSVDPPLEQLAGRVLRRLERLGKRLVFCLDDDYFVILHLMIARRLRWQRPGTPRGCRRSSSPRSSRWRRSTDCIAPPATR